MSKTEKPPRFHRSRTRLQQTLVDARAVRENPRAVGSIVRRGFVRLWRLRGGGFYGLGWVVCFFWLQFQALRGDVTEAQGVADFASNWLLEKLLTFGLETFINMGLAFAWPGFLIDRLGGYGIAALVAGFVVVDRLARPRILALFPELDEQQEVQDEPAEADPTDGLADRAEPEIGADTMLSSPAKLLDEGDTKDERR